MAGAAGGAGWLRIRRQWLHFVAGLDLDHVRHVRRIEELRAIGRRRELRAGPKYLLDAGGVSPFQSGPTTM